MKFKNFPNWLKGGLLGILALFGLVLLILFIIFLKVAVDKGIGEAFSSVIGFVGLIVLYIIFAPIAGENILEEKGSAWILIAVLTFFITGSMIKVIKEKTKNNR